MNATELHYFVAVGPEAEVWGKGSNFNEAVTNCKNFLKQSPFSKKTGRGKVEVHVLASNQQLSTYVDYSGLIVTAPEGATFVKFKIFI